MAEHSPSPTSFNDMPNLIESRRLHTEVYPNFTIQRDYRIDPYCGLRQPYESEQWVRQYELGRGAYGNVWLERAQNGQLRAVKEVAKYFTEDNKDKRMRELLAMSTCCKGSDYFPIFHGWYEHGPKIFIAMEYFPLGDLMRSSSGAWGEGEAQSICSQITSALVTIHRESITHRDLKPQNVFVVQDNPKWIVKLGDFGIAKRVRGEDTKLRTQYVGRFVALEVMDLLDGEETGGYTSAVDIWALGCLSHWLLTRETPFTSVKVMKNFCSGKITLPLELISRARVSSSCVEFIRRCLSVQHQFRPTAQQALKTRWLKEVNAHRPSVDEQRGKVKVQGLKVCRSLIPLSRNGKLNQKDNMLEPARHSGDLANGDQSRLLAEDEGAHLGYEKLDDSEIHSESSRVTYVDDAFNTSTESVRASLSFAQLRRAPGQAAKEQNCKELDWIGGMEGYMSRVFRPADESPRSMQKYPQDQVNLKGDTIGNPSAFNIGSKRPAKYSPRSGSGHRRQLVEWVRSTLQDELDDKIHYTDTRESHDEPFLPLLLRHEDGPCEYEAYSIAEGFGFVNGEKVWSRVPSRILPYSKKRLQEMVHEQSAEGDVESAFKALAYTDVQHEIFRLVKKKTGSEKEKDFNWVVICIKKLKEPSKSRDTETGVEPVHVILRRLAMPREGIPHPLPVDLEEIFRLGRGLLNKLEECQSRGTRVDERIEKAVKRNASDHELFALEGEKLTLSLRRDCLRWAMALLERERGTDSEEEAIKEAWEVLIAHAQY